MSVSVISILNLKSLILHKRLVGISLLAPCTPMAGQISPKDDYTTNLLG